MSQPTHMRDQMPDAVVFNGVNASEGSRNRGQYLLALSPDDLQQIAMGHAYPKSVLQKAQARIQRQTKRMALLESRRDPNDLAQAGWGVIFPSRSSPRLEEIREVLQPLLDLRRTQAGELYRELVGADGYHPEESAESFMERHKASPAVVDPTRLPFYLLLVGGPEEIPYEVQHALAATYLVGRIHFEHPEEYQHYARSVVDAETTGLRLGRRAVFFGTRHAGDTATTLSDELLVEPLAKEVAQRNSDWLVEHLRPEDCTKARLRDLLGERDAPALLFTASHGVGFDPDDPMQLDFQGGLLCQDLPAIDESISRDHYLAAEDIGDAFKLHGLVSFHFACFGAGTPRFDSFSRPSGRTRQQIAPRDFLAGLPRRLLSHRNGGALAVIGHIDRAWTYSFKWGQAGQQTQTFRETLEGLMSGKRVGLALDPFNVRFAQIAVHLNNMLGDAGGRRYPSVEWAGLWTANNDARGYALLGDPAVRLPVVSDSEQPSTRRALEMPRVSPAEARSSAITDRAPKLEPEPGIDSHPPGGTDVDLRLQLRENLKALATQLDAFADSLDQPTAVGGLDSDLEVDFFPGQRTLEGVGEKLRDSMRALADEIGKFFVDVAELKVSTGYSDDIDSADPFKMQKCVVTKVKLDGDTDVAIRADSSVDEVVWRIHSHALEQAQANRAAMLRAIGELLSGLAPTKT